MLFKLTGIRCIDANTPGTPKGQSTVKPGDVLADDAGNPIYISMATASSLSEVPLDADVAAWPDLTFGLVTGSTGRIFIAYKTSAGVFYVELTHD